MRYLYENSLHIFILYFFSSFLIVLGFSSFIETYHMASLPSNGMSNDYISFQVMFGNNDDINLMDMIDALDKVDKPYVLFCTSNSNVHGVYARNYKLNINITSGRSFSEDDFINRTNTAMVSEEWANKCKIINDKKYIEILGKYFEVIGFFKRRNNYVNPDAYVLFNLLSENYISHGNYVIGFYSLDIGEHAAEAVAKLKNIISFMFTHTPKDNNFISRIKTAVDVQGISSYIIILVIFMVLLNSADATIAWLQNRRKTILVHIICGATNREINKNLIREYTLIMLTTSIMGLLCAIPCSLFITKLGIPLFKGFNYSFYTLLCSLIPTLILGIAILCILLFYYNHRKNLIDIYRW